MANLNGTSFANLYGSSGTTFPDNATGEISEGDVRQFGQDIKDSFLNRNDDYTTQTALITLSAAEILNLNSSPKQIVAAPGANKVIIVHHALLVYTFVSAAYATNTTLEVIWNGLSASSIGFIGALAATANRQSIAVPSALSAAVDFSNKAIMARAQTGNPTTGDSTAKLAVTYSILSI